MNNNFSSIFEKSMKYTTYRYLVFLMGLPVILYTYYIYKKKSVTSPISKIFKEVTREFEESKVKTIIREKTRKSLIKKYSFFNKDIKSKAFNSELDNLTNKEFKLLIDEEVEQRLLISGSDRVTFISVFKELYSNNTFRKLSYIIGFPMYVLLFIFNRPYAKYILERLLMLVFVIFGVTALVFTILYISPMDPSVNILGRTATKEQVLAFKQQYGLDKPYLIQLLNSFKSVITFDFGNSFVGNEPVMEGILRKFPITLKVTLASLFISVIIAIPAGIISAKKQYSAFDYSSMIIALIGISIPNFWLGLMLILLFSVNLGWLNVIYAGDLKSLIMPAIVLGTALAASCARMTRSSVLEVIKSDYITTARAKGVKERDIVLKHALNNAIIPIITIVGLQFGGMLGGAAVTEKVFTIPGIGSHIIDKQMIPDVPVVLAGVVYIAIVISVVNLIVDILYAIFDPRIKAKLKNY